MWLKKSSIIGIIITVILGSLLHFTYAWSGQRQIIGIFSAVNESTWEHLKLLFTPFLMFSIVEECIVGKDVKNFIPAKVIGVLSGMLTIISVFYTYTGIIGNNFLVLDILTFIIGVIVAFKVSELIMQTDKFTSPKANIIAVITLIIVILMFILFTFHVPNINLFVDPTSI